MSVFLADEQGAPVDLDRLRLLAELVMAEEGYPESAEVTVLLVDEDEIASYNRRFLKRDGPTDVLAFPVEELVPGTAPEHDPTGPPLLVGDVVIAPGYVQRHARDNGSSFEEEMALMVTHGILHLLGYDHQTDEDAEVMEGRETELLAKVGVNRR